MMDFIKSRDNEKVKNYTKLRDDSHERAINNKFCVEGIKLCADLCVRLVCVRAFFTQKAEQAAMAFLPKECEKYLIDDSVAQKLSDVKENQGLFCEFMMLQPITENYSGNWLCMDNVQNPDNVGAILRSAAAFGFCGIALSENCADVFSPKALRASMGAAAKLNIIKGCDLQQFLTSFKLSGGTAYAACLENSIPLSEVATSTNIALVIGNEGSGIRQQILSVCDVSVRIPISTEIESLNAAVAAGVLMWHFKGGNII